MSILDFLFIVIVVVTLFYPLIAQRLSEWRDVWSLSTKQRRDDTK